MTETEYEDWKDTLPIRDAIDADLLAHVGHYPWEYLPTRCVACQLHQKMMETLL